MAGLRAFAVVYYSDTTNGTCWYVLEDVNASEAKRSALEGPWSSVATNNLLDIFPKGEMTYQEIHERVTNEHS